MRALGIGSEHATAHAAHAAHTTTTHTAGWWSLLLRRLDNSDLRSAKK
jgi:hypothetical protein